VSDEIMHITDWFTTILRVAGVDPPADRVIDGVDQLAWLTGEQPSSARDGYIYWMGPEMFGVKWRNFKLVLVEQRLSTDPPAKLSSPRIINLVADPQEREPINLPHLHSWTASHFNQILSQFHASLQREPLIPSGSSLDHTPQPT
jgi:arylsulfatase